MGSDSPCPTTAPVLILLRGNSGSGKSTVAAALRQAYGRGLAIIGQDVVRREILRERDLPGAANITMIDLMARHALAHGFHVVVEGIMYAERYGDMLSALVRDHRGASHAYYFDLPFAETVRRHAGKPIAHEIGEAELRAWWRPCDLLSNVVEQIIDESSSLESTVERVLQDTSLLTMATGRPGHRTP